MISNLSFCFTFLQIFKIGWSEVSWIENVFDLGNDEKWSCVSSMIFHEFIYQSVSSYPYVTCQSTVRDKWWKVIRIKSRIISDLLWKSFYSLYCTKYEWLADIRLLDERRHHMEVRFQQNTFRSIVLSWDVSPNRTNIPKLLLLSTCKSLTQWYVYNSMEPECAIYVMRQSWTSLDAKKKMFSHK